MSPAWVRGAGGSGITSSSADAGTARIESISAEENPVIDTSSSIEVSSRD